MRIAKDQKSLIEKAVAISGGDLSRFVIAAASKEAMRTIEAYGRADLTRLESEAFVTALSEPLPPNSALRSALDAYKAKTK